jgi:hypothetical protein
VRLRARRHLHEQRHADGDAKSQRCDLPAAGEARSSSDRGNSYCRPTGFLIVARGTSQKWRQLSHMAKNGCKRCTCQVAALKSSGGIEIYFTSDSAGQSEVRQQTCRSTRDVWGHVARDLSGPMLCRIVGRRTEERGYRRDVACAYWNSSAVSAMRGVLAGLVLPASTATSM